MQMIVELGSFRTPRA